MSVYVIAEIGINHNGSMETCRELIDVAVKCGCNAVKFQKRDIDQVYTQDFLAELRESPWGTTQRDQKAGLEFGLEEYREIDSYCKEKGIDWFASAWDLNSQEFLRQFDCKYNKVASAMVVYQELLQMIASEGRHTFISTGMATYEDIDKAVAIFKEAGCPHEVVHCVSTYPMLPEDANLNTIKTLQNRYGCDVGYSGHEIGKAISWAAVALGVSSLERHLTIDRSMYGSDQPASMEPAEMLSLVGGVRKIEKAMGDGEKTIIDAEKPIAEKLRAHFK